MPQSDRVDAGNVYDVNDWPTTNLEPHDISNIMGYEFDSCMSHFTHDQSESNSNTPAHAHMLVLENMC